MCELCLQLKVCKTFVVKTLEIQGICKNLINDDNLRFSKSWVTIFEWKKTQKSFENQFSPDNYASPSICSVFESYHKTSNKARGSQSFFEATNAGLIEIWVLLEGRSYFILFYILKKKIDLQHQRKCFGHLLRYLKSVNQCQNKCDALNFIKINKFYGHDSCYALGNKFTSK